MMNSFEPNILGFLCNWCSYEGADGAGRARLAYYANFKAVRLMCSGRIGPQFIMEAFSAGADGVLIVGCPPGSCHYKTGNMEALKRFMVLKKMLGQFGFAEDRLRIDWVSASEAEKYVQVVTQMVNDVRSLGPLRC
ncbi:MAG: hydrogenase iron-sulfur subunit, partial [Proteobacteria bacterium]|nr:hydrogenase iron-sulfur subunit [Pseudomonadota bacterium]